MPGPNTYNLSYVGLDRPTLPYRSYTSPIDESPHWCRGSVNGLATVAGWMEKRPGFSAAIETALSELPGFANRLFTWKRFTSSLTKPGHFFLMASVRVTEASAVYALDITAGGSFQQIHIDYGSAEPFDFVVDRNFVHFGNGTTRANMRKWDGTDLSLWGVDGPIAAPDISLTSGSLPAGISFDVTTGMISGTPVSAGTSSLTVSVTDAAGATASQLLTLEVEDSGLEWKTGTTLAPGVQGAAYSTTLAAVGGSGTITYAVAGGSSLPAGITLTSSGVLSGTPTTPTGATGRTFVVNATDGVATVASRAFSLFIGSSAITITPTGAQTGTVGSPLSITYSASGGTGPYKFSLVSGAVPSGLTMSSAGVLGGTPTAGGVYNITVRVVDSASLAGEIIVPLTIAASTLSITTTTLPNAKVGQSYSQTVRVDGGSQPYSITFTAGDLSAQTGYRYGYTYTSIYGHESSMSPLSDSTGLFTDQAVGVDMVASTDPQVNGINLYRTTDGGDADPAVMRLVASLANATQGYVDATQDIYLGNQTGPGLYVNDPPQPGSGFVWSNGRIWYLKDDVTWFTGDEEITNGIPSECVSDAKDGNFYRWPSTVGGMAVTPNGVDIGLAEEFWQVSGDTLDTFRKSLLLPGGGVLSPTAICSVGGVVYWFDTARQFFSSAEGEIGEAIRSDLGGADGTRVYVCFHKFGRRNFICLLDATEPLTAKLYLLDLDLKQWQTPWTVVGATALTSGQTGPSTISLIMSFDSGHVRTLAEDTYNDDGAAYADELRSYLFSIVPGRGTTARNRTEVRQVRQFELELSTIAQTDVDGNPTPSLAATPTFFGVVTDDDPGKAGLVSDVFVDVTDSGETLQYRPDPNDPFTPGFLARRWIADFTIPLSARVAFAAHWDAAEQPWRVYSMDVAFQAQ